MSLRGLFFCLLNDLSEGLSFQFVILPFFRLEGKTLFCGLKTPFLLPLYLHFSVSGQFFLSAFLLDDKITLLRTCRGDLGYLRTTFRTLRQGKSLPYGDSSALLLEVKSLSYGRRIVILTQLAKLM